MAVLNKKALADLLAEKTGTTKKAAKETLEAVLETTVDALNEGHDISLTGFGKITQRVVPEQERFIALVGETRVIAEHTVLKAKLSKTILK